LNQFMLARIFKSRERMKKEEKNENRRTCNTRSGMQEGI
jgi:hypothetical protein